MENANTKILFINRYQNYAWVRTDKGSFVTSDGNVYEFDLIGKDFRSREHFAPNDVIKECANILHNNNPIKTIDKTKILEAYNLINEIDKSSEMLVAQIANDAGQKTLFAYYNDAFVPLATAGDRNGSVECEKVKKILDILNDVDFYTWESFGEMCPIEQIKQRNPMKVKLFDDNARFF